MDYSSWKRIETVTDRGGVTWGRVVPMWSDHTRHPMLSVMITLTTLYGIPISPLTPPPFSCFLFPRAMAGRLPLEANKSQDNLPSGPRVPHPAHPLGLIDHTRHGIWDYEEVANTLTPGSVLIYFEMLHDHRRFIKQWLWRGKQILPRLGPHRQRSGKWSSLPAM